MDRRIWDVVVNGKCRVSNEIIKSGGKTVLCKVRVLARSMAEPGERRVSRAWHVSSKPRQEQRRTRFLR